jgi:hypothetical protein
MQTHNNTDHWEYMLVLLHQTLHQHRPRTVVLEELLHLRWQLFCCMAPDGVNTHRASQEDKVRVDHPRVRVPLVVEKIYRKKVNICAFRVCRKASRRRQGVPCHCCTIPWNSLLNTRTLTPMLYCEAVASSIAVMLNDASPSMSTTVFCGAATLAPMAAGRPKPIV